MSLHHSLDYIYISKKCSFIMLYKTSTCIFWLIQIQIKDFSTTFPCQPASTPKLTTLPARPAKSGRVHGGRRTPRRMPSWATGPEQLPLLSAFVVAPSSRRTTSRPTQNFGGPKMRSRTMIIYDNICWCCIIMYHLYSYMMRYINMMHMIWPMTSSPEHLTIVTIFDWSHV